MNKKFFSIITMVSLLFLASCMKPVVDEEVILEDDISIVDENSSDEEVDFEFEEIE